MARIDTEAAPTMHNAGINLGHGYVKLRIDRQFFQYASIASRDVIVVDFGYFTTDVNAIAKMTLNPQVAGSINKAMRDVYQRVGDELQRRYGKRYTDLQIEQAVLDRHPITWRGQVLPLSDPLSAAANQVAIEILNWLRARIDRSHELILVTGGGAPLMTGFVRAAFPDAEVLMVGEPQQANAYGYYRIARRIIGGARG